MQNKLSIITINRNNAEGLQKTIKSVVNQTYNDYEYIIVDGASTDSSLEIIQHFNTSVKKQIVWISESDSGVYQAMNKGIRMSKGEYLLFLNSGDFLVSDNVLNDIFSNNYFGDILCGSCNISEGGKVVHVTNPPKVITFSTLYNVGLAHQATFIRRNLFDRFGFYDESFIYNADIEFWNRCIILGEVTTEKLNVIVSDYNLDGISSTQNKSDEYKEEINRIFHNSYFQKFTPDYDTWNFERKEMDVFYWVKSKKILYKPLLWLYYLVRIARK